MTKAAPRSFEELLDVLLENDVELRLLLVKADKRHARLRKAISEHKRTMDVPGAIRVKQDKRLWAVLEA